MNIIITGLKGSGKSVLASKVLEGCGCSVSGFRTVFENRCDADQTLYVESLDRSCRMAAAQWTEDGRKLVPEAFDSFAPSLINQDSRLVFIDELGFLEKDSESLRRAVESAFDGQQNVVAVIRIDAKGWTQELKARRDVTVVSITRDNRDSLSDHILRLLSK